MILKKNLLFFEMIIEEFIIINFESIFYFDVFGGIIIEYRYYV